MFEKLRNFVVKHKALTSTAAVGTTALATSLPCFAEGEQNLVMVTSDMLTPITNSITGNVGNTLPVGILIFAILLGISIIPRIIYKFF